MYYTIEIIHRNGDVRHEGVFEFEPQGYKLKQFHLRYPKSKVQPVVIHGVVPCFECGEPVVITDAFKALRIRQSDDKLLCQECTSLAKGK